MPRASSFLAVFVPTPCRSLVGRSPMTSNHVWRVSRNTPCGLANPVAIFARSRLSPMPTEQCRPVASRTAACTDLANASGSSVSTPRNASSQPITSTVASRERSVSITVAETAV